MTNFDLGNDYSSNGLSVQDLFGRMELGFFVPPYQRAYTWDDYNIEQLFEDLFLGICELVENSSGATFLGTAILADKSDRSDVVVDGEDRAKPTGVQVVIDGQQRISTLALLSIQLIQKIKTLRQQLSGTKYEDQDLYNQANKFIGWLECLYKMDSGDGAQPRYKPKIIHGRYRDRWTYRGDDNKYKSSVAHYIAVFIRKEDATEAKDSLDKIVGSRVLKNLELIDTWLNRITELHVPETEAFERFPALRDVYKGSIQEMVLGFASDEVNSLPEEDNFINTGSEEYCAAAVYHLYVFTYYLLRRCGFNTLRPAHEEWGFDMFQALNSTGVPLTVLETFLPTVMKTEPDNEWDGSPSKIHIDNVQALIDVARTNEQKNARTNELFGTFALCYSGEEISNKFSFQRRWLARSYDEKLKSLEEKRDFLKKLSHVADFYYNCWYMDDSANSQCISGLEAHPEGKLASLIIDYLNSARAKLAGAILARFYSDAVEKDDFDEFIEAAKACAAFFTLWRSSGTTQDLPRSYRHYFQGSQGNVSVEAHNWKDSSKAVSSTELKSYFRSALKNRGIHQLDAWASRADQFLLYSEVKAICRFCLFLAGHNRIVDKKNPGLTVEGTKGSNELLTLEKWTGKTYGTLEHIAPQRPSRQASWDAKIYESGLADQIGNLILLDKKVNQHVSNRDWQERRLYYSFVGVSETSKIRNLTKQAEQRNMKLTEKSTNALRQMELNRTFEPILMVGEKGKEWDADIIRKRTEQIKQIIYKRLYEWLN